MNASFFILISFCVFGFIFIKKLWPSLIEFLDEHIAYIKNEFHIRKSNIIEHEKLKTFYQDRLQHLHKEIEELKTQSNQKLDFLRMKLDTEMELQYAYRQESFRQIVHRMHQQQKKVLQTKCAEEILARVQEEIKNNPSFSDEYVVSILEKRK